MAEQPYYRPYEPSGELQADGTYSGPFKDGRSNRPLERGVIHRAQNLETDPLVTGLTREEWGRIYARNANPVADLAAPTQIVNREITFGAPRFDPRVPGDPKVFATDFPFPIGVDDLERGRERYTIYCAVCHGPLGNGQGKIWERSYLLPTSFHTEMVGEHELDVSHRQAQASPLGYSRGYALWGISIPMREVPVGYIHEVIAKGYGGMPNYSAQISPADRWRIVAYVRALQYSQHAPAPEPAGGKK